MKVGDLVTYGKWFVDHVHGISRVGVILEDGDQNSFYVWWSGHEPEWECEEDLEILNAVA